MCLRCHSPGCPLCWWLCMRCPVRGKQAGERGQPLPKPLKGPAGRTCLAVVVHQDKVCAVGPACLPRQRPHCGGHLCHDCSCHWAEHKDVSERGQHRTAAGVRADVLSRVPVPVRHRNAPMHGLPSRSPPSEDALAPVQALDRDHTPRLPPRHRCTWLPRSPVMRVTRLRRRPLLLMLILLGRCCAA